MFLASNLRNNRHQPQETSKITAATDLDSAKLPCPDQCPDLVLVHIQLFRCLRDRQEAVLLGFVVDRFILCAAAVWSSYV
jgi:hypothetical protein